jgi:hypothetical protein
MSGKLANAELESMKKEVFVAEEARRDCGNNQNCYPSCRDLKRVPPEYEVWMLLTQQTASILFPERYNCVPVKNKITNFSR